MGYKGGGPHSRPPLPLALRTEDRSGMKAPKPHVPTTSTTTVVTWTTHPSFRVNKKVCTRRFLGSRVGSSCRKKKATVSDWEQGEFSHPHPLHVPGKTIYSFWWTQRGHTALGFPFPVEA